MNLACSCFEIVLLVAVVRSLDFVCILSLCGKALQTGESHERRKIVNQAPPLDGGNNPKQSPPFDRGQQITLGIPERYCESGRSAAAGKMEEAGWAERDKSS